MYNLTRAEKREREEYDIICKRIREATVQYIPKESVADKDKRKAALLKNFETFAKYYFAHLMDSDFAYFHKEAARRIEKDPKVFAVLEWPREHAKSVFTDIMLVMYLYAKKQVTGLVMVSANKDKAETLLSDIQAELTSNELWLNDYGNLAQYGDWSAGEFSLTDDTGFWAFGRKQSPRGIRKAAKRPNLCIVDDIDDSELVKNTDRVLDVKAWLLGDLYFALPIKGCRIIMIGNRFHKNCTLAHVVGDVETGDPLNENVSFHSKVFALENPRTKKMDLSGEPAWKERYSRDEILSKMKIATERPALREFFHQHIEDGKTFKREWLQYCPMLPREAYTSILAYCDPSYKNTAQSDYKAIIVVGKVGKHKKNTLIREGSLHILAAYVERTTPINMVRTFYDYFEQFKDLKCWIEANFNQDLLGKDEFYNEGLERGYHLPIKQDTQKKTDKVGRIENISPLFERNLIYFNEDQRQSVGLQRLIEQLLSFPTGHDDAPDALQGAIEKLQKATRKSNTGVRTGKYSRNKSRE
jgi:predicted phage terminase large subunit-like protein